MPELGAIGKNATSTSKIGAERPGAYIGAAYGPGEPFAIVGWYRPDNFVIVQSGGGISIY